MKEFAIDDLNSLLKAADYMHDAGFTRESIKYDKNNGIFGIAAKRYRYTGKIFQRKTNIVEGEFNLALFHVKTCDIIEKDKKGYKAIGEDYFNNVKVKNSKFLVIKATFHEIKLEIGNISGKYKYCPFADSGI